MLKNFENWLLENNYSASTSADYMGRIERLCRKEEFTLAYLVENIASIRSSSRGKNTCPIPCRTKLRRFSNSSGIL